MKEDETITDMNPSIVARVPKKVLRPGLLIGYCKNRDQNQDKKMTPSQYRLAERGSVEFHKHYEKYLNHLGTIFLTLSGDRTISPIGTKVISDILSNSIRR